jgi:glycosyltransferase involved in cell wall biosynthesis
MSIAIAACSKFEQDTILQWALFHKLVGVDQIFLFDDGSDDTKKVLEPLIREGFVVYHHWNQHPAQMQAMNYYLDHNRAKHEYTAFIDCDEYLVPEHVYHRSLKTIDFGNGIALPWVMCGSKNLLTRNKEVLVMEEFNLRADFKIPHTIHCKVIIKNSICPRLTSIHNISDSGRDLGITYTDGTPYRGFNHPGETYNYGKLFLAHYWGLSWEEYQHRKIKRGASDREHFEYTRGMWDASNNWQNSMYFTQRIPYLKALKGLMEIYS